MEKITNNKEYVDRIFDNITLISLDVFNSEFEECEFNDCDFSSTTFNRCKFLNCSFSRCNLSLAKVPNSRFFEVDFVECKLVGIDWTSAIWPSFHLNPEIRFSKCILNYSSFMALTLNELRLNSCKLHEVDLREGDFSGSSMTDCDFSNSLFMHTNLRDVDFTESYNFNIDVFENKISKAKFSRYEALSLLDSLEIELVD